MIRFILTCDGECPYGFHREGRKCPQECERATYEKEQVNTEVPSDE